MANATAAMSISTAAGVVLFGLTHLFVQQPNAVAVGYTLYTICNIAPHILPTYNTTTARFDSILLNPSASRPDSASSSALEHEPASIIVNQTPGKPAARTVRNKADILSIDREESTNHGVQQHNIYGLFNAATKEIRSTCLTPKIAPQSGTGPSDAPTTHSAASIKPSGASQPSDDDDDADVTCTDYWDFVDILKPNTWLLGMFTWLPLIFFSIHGKLVKGHERRERYFSLIVGSAYAIAVAYLAGSDRPWELLRSLWQPVHMLAVYWVLKWQWSTWCYVDRFTRMFWWMKWKRDHDNKKTSINAFIAVLIQMPLLIVVTMTALSDFMARCVQDPFYMRAHIASATHNAIWLPPQFTHFLLWLWLHGCDLRARITSSWLDVTVFLVVINTGVAFCAYYAEDVLVSLLVQVPIVMGSLYYLHEERVARWIYWARTATYHSIVSSRQTLAAFIENVKGWLILYAIIAYVFNAPAILNLGTQEVQTAKIPWRPTFWKLPFDWSRVNIIITKAELYNQWFHVTYAITTPFINWFEKAPDAKDWVDYVVGYVIWVFTNPCDSWASVYYYLFQPISRVLPNRSATKVLLWFWAPVKTLWIKWVDKAPMLSNRATIIAKNLKVVATQRQNAWSKTFSEHICNIVAYVFYADRCPMALSLLGGIFEAMIITAFVTATCLALYHAQPRRTGRWSIACVYFMVAFTHLLFLDCLQEVIAAIAAAIVVFLLFCISWFYVPVVAFVGDAFDGFMGTLRAVYASSHRFYVRVSDAILHLFFMLPHRIALGAEYRTRGDAGDTAQVGLPDIWAAIESDDFEESEDDQKPSRPPINTCTVVIVEEQPVIKNPHPVTPVTKKSLVGKDKVNGEDMKRAERAETLKLRKLKIWNDMRRLTVDKKLTQTIVPISPADHETIEIELGPLVKKPVQTTPISSKPENAHSGQKSVSPLEVLHAQERAKEAQLDKDEEARKSTFNEIIDQRRQGLQERKIQIEENDRIITELRASIDTAEESVNITTDDILPEAVIELAQPVVPPTEQAPAPSTTPFLFAFNLAVPEKQPVFPQGFAPLPGGKPIQGSKPSPGPSTGFKVPNGSDDPSNESDKDDEQPGSKPDANAPTKKFDEPKPDQSRPESEKQDAEELAKVFGQYGPAGKKFDEKEPPKKPAQPKSEDNKLAVEHTPVPVPASASLPAPKPGAQTHRVAPTPTTFARRTSLSINNFPLPNLYNRPNTTLPATGVDSTEQWRNRILGGPSTLTLMRREAEAAANNSSNSPTEGGGGGGGSSGTHPPCPSAVTSPKECEDKGDDGDASPEASTDKKCDGDENNSHPNGGSALIAVAFAGIGDDDDTFMGDAARADDAAYTCKPMNGGDEMEVDRDSPSEFSTQAGTVVDTDGDIDMDDTPSDVAVIDTSKAPDQQSSTTQAPPLNIRPATSSSMTPGVSQFVPAQASTQPTAPTATQGLQGQVSSLGNSFLSNATTSPTPPPPPTVPIIQPPQQSTFFTLETLTTSTPTTKPSTLATQPQQQSSIAPLNIPGLNQQNVSTVPPASATAIPTAQSSHNNADLTAAPPAECKSPADGDQRFIASAYPPAGDENTSDDQEPEILSLSSEALQDTAEGEKMLANARKGLSKEYIEDSDKSNDILSDVPDDLSDQGSPTDKTTNAKKPSWAADKRTPDDSSDYGEEASTPLRDNARKPSWGGYRGPNVLRSSIEYEDESTPMKQ